MAKVKTEVTCVRKHQEAFEKQARENTAAAKAMEKGAAEVVAGIRAQERENAAAGKAIEKGTAEVVAGIRAQERENTAAAKEIWKGVAAVKAGIKAQEKDTEKFIDLFYHGYVKKG